MQQSETMPTFVDLNILPVELRPRRYSSLYVLAILALLAVTLALVPLYQADRAAGDEVARLQAELDLMGYNLTLVQTDLGEARGLQRQMEAAEAAMASLSEERQEVLGDGQELSKDLSVALLDSSPGEGVASASGIDGQMMLTGQALSQEVVFEYAGMLESSGRFSEARVTSLAVGGEEAEGSALTFTIEVIR